MDGIVVEMWHCRVLNVDVDVDVGVGVASAYKAIGEQGMSLKNKVEHYE